jgi:hypothetical protein
MAEDSGAESTVTVTAFEDADNAAFNACAFFCRNADHVTGEAGIEFGRDIDVVPLHPWILILAGVKAGREEDGGS